MNVNYEHVLADHVIVGKGEAFGVACLAAIGIMSIFYAMTQGAYRLGRQDKEREMKKELKKAKKFWKKIEL